MPQETLRKHPLCRAEDLGKPIPNTKHAVSMCLQSAQQNAARHTDQQHQSTLPADRHDNQAEAIVLPKTGAHYHSAARDRTAVVMDKLERPFVQGHASDHNASYTVP